MMRFICTALLLSILCGCATSTIESRKEERAEVYASLSEADRKSVDQGEVRVGMSRDAVYISWGEPDQVMNSGNSDGVVETWLYHGSTLERRHRWGVREVFDQRGRNYLITTYDPEYVSRQYVRAEISFSDGKVRSWKTLARPLEGEPGRF